MGMEKKRTKGWLLAVSVLLAAVLAGCGGSAEKPAQPASVAETKPAVETPAAETKPAAETPVVETRAMPQQENETEGPAGWEFATIAGDWYSLDSADALLIYRNGGFNLYRASDDTYYDGYLVFTEKKGDGPWQSGPRYELYLENNEPMENVWVSVEEDGNLALCEGGGAVRLRRTEGAAVEPMAVQVAYSSDVDLPDAEYFNAAGENEGVLVAFFTEDISVKNVQVVALYLKDMSPEGVPTFLYESLYQMETLSPEKGLVVNMVFYGDMPNNGILYTDADGVEHLCAVEMSGMDGSLYLLEI